MKLTTCNRPGCSEEIWWAETTEGKNMPVNKWSTPSGNVVAVDAEADKPIVVVLKNGQVPGEGDMAYLPAGSRRYLAHFVTCKANKKKRKT